MLQGLLTCHSQFTLPRLCFFQLSPEHLSQEVPAVCYVIAAEVAQACIPKKCCGIVSLKLAYVSYGTCCCAALSFVGNK